MRRFSLTASQKGLLSSSATGISFGMSVPALVCAGVHGKRRPAGQTADLRLHEARHCAAIGAEHHHLETLVDIALRELGARGVNARDLFVLLAGFEDAVHGGDVL